MSAEFYLDGRRARRIIGGLVMFCGLLLFFSGCVLDRVGHTVHQRYEQGAGKLLRSFSPEDQQFHRSAQVAMVGGWVLEALAAAVTGFGLALWLKPGLLPSLFQRFAPGVTRSETRSG